MRRLFIIFSLVLIFGGIRTAPCWTLMQTQDCCGDFSSAALSEANESCCELTSLDRIVGDFSEARSFVAGWMGPEKISATVVYQPRFVSQKFFASRSPPKTPSYIFYASLLL